MSQHDHLFGCGCDCGCDRFRDFLTQANRRDECGCTHVREGLMFTSVGSGD
jgi:hypothetical protein